MSIRCTFFSKVMLPAMIALIGFTSFARADKDKDRAVALKNAQKFHAAETDATIMYEELQESEDAKGESYGSATNEELDLGKKLIADQMKAREEFTFWMSEYLKDSLDDIIHNPNFIRDINNAELTSNTYPSLKLFITPPTVKADFIANLKKRDWINTAVLKRTIETLKSPSFADTANLATFIEKFFLNLKTAKMFDILLGFDGRSGFLTFLTNNAGQEYNLQTIDAFLKTLIRNHNEQISIGDLHNVLANDYIALINSYITLEQTPNSGAELIYTTLLDIKKARKALYPILKDFTYRHALDGSGGKFSVMEAKLFQSSDTLTFEFIDCEKIYGLLPPAAAI